MKNAESTWCEIHAAEWYPKLEENKNIRELKPL